MTTYISILRGINVSGHNIIKMDALRYLYTELNFKNIQTYIQSGNVIFQTVKTNTEILTSKIENGISEKFGLAVPVIVLETEELKKIVKGNPFIKDKRKDDSFLHITFLAEQPAKENYDKIKDLKFHPDEFILKGRAVYLYCPNKYSNSKLSNSFFENKLKVTATTRNRKTANELLYIAEKVNNL